MRTEQPKFRWQNFKYSAGRFLIELSEQRATIIVFSAGIAFLIGSIELGAHTLLLKHAAVRRVADVGDAFVIAVFVFLLTYIELSVVKERRLRVIREIRTIAELNHRIRNALEIIQYAAYTSTDHAQLGLITQAIERIDNILRELYPVLGPAKKETQ